MPYDAVPQFYSVCDYFFRQDPRIKKEAVSFFFSFCRTFLHNNFYHMGDTKGMVFPDRAEYFQSQSRRFFFPQSTLDE